MNDFTHGCDIPHSPEVSDDENTTNTNTTTTESLLFHEKSETPAKKKTSFKRSNALEI